MLQPRNLFMPLLVIGSIVPALSADDESQYQTWTFRDGGKWEAKLIDIKLTLRNIENEREGDVSIDRLSTQSKESIRTVINEWASGVKVTGKVDKWTLDKTGQEITAKLIDVKFTLRFRSNGKEKDVSIDELSTETKALVVNSRGLKVSGKMGSTGEVHGEPPQVGPAKKRAVIAGSNVYNHEGKGLKTLSYCDNDAIGVAEAFRRLGFDEVVTLTDRSDEFGRLPFKKNIEDQIERVIESTSAGDTLVFYFAGHGLYLNGKGYLCPRDADPDRPEETMLSLQSVYESLAQSGAAVKFVIADACRNSPGGEGSAAALSKELLRERKGIVTLSSCSEGRRSFEDPKLKHGIFSYHLIQGLLGRASQVRDRDEIRTRSVMLMGLCNYVMAEVENYSKRTGARQRPAVSVKEANNFELGSFEIGAASYQLDLTHVNVGRVPEGWRTEGGEVGVELERSIPVLRPLAEGAGRISRDATLSGDFYAKLEFLPGSHFNLELAGPGGCTIQVANHAGITAITAHGKRVDLQARGNGGPSTVWIERRVEDGEPVFVVRYNANGEKPISFSGAAGAVTEIALAFSNNQGGVSHVEFGPLLPPRKLPSFVGRVKLTQTVKGGSNGITRLQTSAPLFLEGQFSASFSVVSPTGQTQLCVVLLGAEASEDLPIDITIGAGQVAIGSPASIRGGEAVAGPGPSHPFQISVKDMTAQIQYAGKVLHSFDLKRVGQESCGPFDAIQFCITHDATARIAGLAIH